MLAIEAGWWLAEVGRQPWILRGYMRVEDAATTSGHVDIMLILFAGLIFSTWDRKYRRINSYVQKESSRARNRRSTC